MFVFACPACPSSAWALPQEFGDRICSKNLQFSSGISEALFPACSQSRLQRFSRSMCQHSSSCGVKGHSHCCWGIPRQFKFQNLLWVVGTFKKYRRDFFPCQVYWEDGNAKPAKPLCWTVLKLAISSCTQQPLYSRSFLLNPFTPEAFCWILILEYSTTTVYVKF